MIKIKLMEWTIKTFGGPKQGDLLNFSSQVSEVSMKGKNFVVSEIKITFQIRRYDKKLVNKKNYDKWLKELNELTDNSVRKFHCDDSDLFQSDQNQTIKAKSFLLIINIFYKQEV